MTHTLNTSPPHAVRDSSFHIGVHYLCYPGGRAGVTFDAYAGLLSSGWITKTDQS